ncbi:hypothetical protein [Embleya hyalina]|uniref:Galactan 5-O-arabinofuranosyltransferase n=1 Tax=Embleya hyalina TaxID=516124 RepID=A0A401YIC8_9ACTN|nr:hypothetical protein [Embleya hyalina]GCD94299.1 hypothetical protein EHYA_01959 [Embleya hyalina]
MNTAVTAPPYSEPRSVARVTPWQGWWERKRWLLITAEAFVAFVSCLILPFLVRGLNVNPVKRTGAVSGLAALQFRFTALGILLIVAIIVSQRVASGRYYKVVTRLSAASVAGLASGFVAGGTVIALLGTPWPISGTYGDAGSLATWAHSMQHGLPVNKAGSVYPPLPPRTIALWADLFHDGNTLYAFKDLQIIGGAATGPLTYLAWRLHLSPVWALAVGVLPALSLMDTFKPYGQTTLLILLPILAKCLQWLHRIGDASYRQILILSAAFGVTFGLIFLTYSGWFVFSALGTVAAVGILFPWRTALRKGLIFVGATGAIFLAVCGFYLVDLLRGAGTKDQAYGFDAYVDPAFFQLWRTDMPGPVTLWPPPGELGGVGVWTILVFLGLGLALWLGFRKPIVITFVCFFGSAWLMRMWFASKMFVTESVQLWPRTGNQLVYTSFVLTALAIYLFQARIRTLWSDVSARFTDGTARALPGSKSAVIGAMVTLMLLFGTMASSISDRYMPSDENTYRKLTYISQTLEKVNGKCPKYAPKGKCVSLDPQWRKMLTDKK